LTKVVAAIFSRRRSARGFCWDYISMQSARVPAKQFRVKVIGKSRALFSHVTNGIIRALTLHVNHFVSTEFVYAVYSNTCHQLFMEWPSRAYVMWKCGWPTAVTSSSPPCQLDIQT